MLQNLKEHVDAAWGRENCLLDQLCLEPSRTLALLFLLALGVRSKRQIRNLVDLVQQLPEELLAIVKPEHVVNWIHDNIPRSKQQTDSFAIFAFDEVCSPLTSLLLSCQCYASMHLIADRSWSPHIVGLSMSLATLALAHSTADCAGQQPSTTSKAPCEGGIRASTSHQEAAAKGSLLDSACSQPSEDAFLHDWCELPVMPPVMPQSEHHLAAIIAPGCNSILAAMIIPGLHFCKP